MYLQKLIDPLYLKLNLRLKQLTRYYLFQYSSFVDLFINYSSSIDIN